MSANFYLLPTDGLCNRMRAIDSAITLSNQLGRNLRVIWVKNTLLSSSFYKLFRKIDDLEVIESRNEYLPGLKLNLFPKNNPATANAITRVPASMLWKFRKRNWDIKGCVFYNELLAISNQKFMNDTPESSQTSYDLIQKKIKESLTSGHSNYIASCWRLCPDQEYYKHFTPIPELTERIDSISATFNHTLGLHIRRTDHKEAMATSSLDKFINLIEQKIRENTNSTFFVATDDAGTETMLRNKFGERILSNKKSSFSRNDEQGIQDAVVDLYCLSRTKKIFGSFRSSFSQVAGDISRIEVETVR
jgi:hypothetical protein